MYVYLVERGFLETENGDIRTNVHLENPNQMDVRTKASNINE